MIAPQSKALAASWRERLDRGAREVEIWREGPLSISLRQHALHIGAGAAMDVVLSMAEVSVCVSPGDTRIDWDTGALDIDQPTADALVAFGLRVIRSDVEGLEPLMSPA